LTWWSQNTNVAAPTAPVSEADDENPPAPQQDLAEANRNTEQALPMQESSLTHDAPSTGEQRSLVESLPSDRRGEDNAPLIPELSPPESDPIWRPLPVSGEKVANHSATSDLTADSVSTSKNSLHVAELIAQHDVQWADGVNPRKILAAGPLSLDSGLVQLRLAQGTELGLHGPIDFELLDGNRVSLRSGKLSAHVPPQAVGFEVKIPGAAIIDLGTEFQTEVQPQERFTHIEVSRGAVEVQIPRGLAGRKRVFRLEQGQAKWISFDGKHALDWRLVVRFGNPQTAPDLLTIDGRSFDVTVPESAAEAMRLVAGRFAEAAQQLSEAPRRTRWIGQLVIDDRSMNLSSARQWDAARVKLMQNIQQRWTKQMLEQFLPPDISREMNELFKGGGFPFPGGDKR
ncbi:MAG: FecR family protein, partial [Pirellulales bacterium]|nr:FecR family protein [Pirellulales bacterium]